MIENQDKNNKRVLYNITLCANLIIIFNFKMIRLAKNSLRVFTHNKNIPALLLSQLDKHLTLYTNQISYSVTKNKNTKVKSSRQIDIQIQAQKWKQMQNNYKSLKTSFGLKPPKQVSERYPKPEKIEYNLQSLRECSSKFPEYLAEELKNKQSRFHSVIQKQMNNLWKAQKKQALQMMEFVYIWKIFDEQTQDLIARAIHKLDLTTNQMFQVLRWFLKQKDEDQIYTNKQKYKDKQSYSENEQDKRFIFIDTLIPLQKKLLSIIQNKVIIRINDDLNPEQYDGIFKIINLGRYFDLYPQKVKQEQPVQKKGQVKNQKQQSSGKSKQKDQKSDKLEQKNFYDIIQEALLKNIEQIPPSSLVTMTVHYANNMKQKQDQKIQILQKIQERLLTNLKFLSHQQLIATAFSYIRTSMMTDKFTKQISRRIQLLYSQMSWQNKKKVLSLALNLPKEYKIFIIGQAQMQIMKGKPIITKLEDGSLKKQFNPKVYIEIDYQLAPQIYLASYEANLISNQLIIRMQDIILNNIFNYSTEDIVKSVWLFTVTEQFNNSLTNLHKKIQTIIQGGFNGGQFSIKDISTVVWSLCNSGKNNQVLYKPQAKFWGNIQFYLQEKLQKCKQKVIHNCSYILWAYAYNKPLRIKTILRITQMILEYSSGPNQVQIITPFELINIIAFYYSLPNKTLPLSINEAMKKLCVSNFQNLYQEMEYMQLIKCLKFLVLDQSQNKITLKIKTWVDIVQIFELQFDKIQYPHIMGIVSFLINCPLGRAKDKKVVDLVQKLIQKKKQMEQLQHIPL